MMVVHRQIELCRVPIHTGVASPVFVDFEASSSCPPMVVSWSLFSFWSFWVGAKLEASSTGKVSEPSTAAGGSIVAVSAILND